MNRDVELIEVIRTQIKRRGRGTEEDPIRMIVQYWSKEGDLLAEVDPFKKTFDYEKERERFYQTILPEVCKKCKLDGKKKQKT